MKRALPHRNFPRSIPRARLARHSRDFLLLTSLEPRRLLSADLNDILTVSANGIPTPVIHDHPLTWYTPARRVTLSSSLLTQAQSADLQPASLQPPAGTPVITPISFSTNAAGLPLLTSRADSGGLKVFLDFDGYNADTPFTLDGDPTTFNAAEQAVIYNCWRDIVSFFSMLNVNVTTVQPPTGGSNPVFVWQRIIGNMTGGAAYVGAITNNSSQGYDNSGDASGRTSGIAHEIGHQLNLNHQSDFSDTGTLINSYTSGWDQRHGPIMGVDYAQTVKKWINGRQEPGADQFQDDLAKMSAYIASKNGIGGDGYMPDDYTGTSIATATSLSLINGAFQVAGSIERLSDSDWFSISSTGQFFDINVEPTFESGFVPKVELYDSNGTLLASKDDAVYRNGNDNNDEEFSLFLPAGNYTVKVMSHGDYGDLGEYAMYASPLPDGWNTTDVRNLTTGRGGYVTYDASTGTFYQGGSGADIWTTTDAFRFTYQILNGNGSITARVTGLDNVGLDSTNASAKAGLMIRESLAHNSKFAMIDFLPTGSQYVYRTTNGGTAASGSTSLSLPNWIRLSRSGNTITLYQSTDGITFTLAGTVNLSALANQVYIGLVTNSHDTNELVTATFTDVALTGTLGATPPTFNSLPAPTNLIATTDTAQTTAMNLTWDLLNQGETGYAIERSVDGVTFTQVATTAADVTTYTDDPGFGSMRWWYRVTALDATGKSVYSNAVSVVNKPKAPAFVQAIKISSSRLSLTWREVPGDTGYRVERSTDGINFTTLATTATNIGSYNATGLAVGTTYTFRITPLSPIGDGVPLVFTATTPLAAPTSITLNNITSSSITVNWTQVASATGYTLFRSTDDTTFTAVATINSGTTLSTIDSGLAALTPYYYYVQAFNAATNGLSSATAFASTAANPALALPWQQSDIGTITGQGNAGQPAFGAFTINAGGNDIAGAADSFHFVYQPLTTDAQIIAQVSSISNTATAAKAGLMIRQDLSAGSRMAGILLNQGNNFGIDVRSRSTTNGQYAFQQALAAVVAPYYLKLTRSGNTVTLFYSTNGITFTQAASLTISLSGTVYVGLAVTAFSATLMNTSTFTNVQFGTTPPGVATPAQADIPTTTAGTVNLSVLGSDNAGENTLIYTWSATGPAPVFFSPNGTNAAKNATATFSASGTYQITATIADANNLQSTSTTSVTITPILTGIGPLNQTLLAGTTQQMSATDQFGFPFSLAGITWSATGGLLTPDGTFTAPSASGTYQITGDTGAFIQSTNVTVAAPVAWYKADASSGTSLADSSGNNRTGTNTGAYSFGTGLIGNAITYTGGNSTLPTGIVASLNNFTISAWVKLTTKDTWARLFDFGTGTTFNMFLTPVSGDGFARFAITTGGGNAEQRITTTTALATGSWYFLAVTLAGTTGTLYINGAVAGTNTSMTLKPSSLGNTNLNYLGKSQYPDPALKGSIDDFRIYNAAASAANISALYAAGPAAASSAPTNLTATSPSANRVNLTWSDKAALETAYLLERSTSPSFTSPTAFLLPTNTTSYSDLTVSPNITYYYRLTALLAGNTSIAPATAAPITPLFDGDANADGKVDAFDLNLLAANWQTSLPGGRSVGDFNNDGKVDAFDLNLLAANWQSGVSLQAAQLAAPFFFHPGVTTTTTSTSPTTSSTSTSTTITTAITTLKTPTSIVHVTTTPLPKPSHPTSAKTVAPLGHPHLPAPAKPRKQFNLLRPFFGPPR